MEIIGAGFKQREAIFALKKGEFKNHAFIEYFNEIRKEFEEILKKLIPKAGKEQTPNGEYEPFKIITECQKTINEVLKRFEYTTHERIEELEKINKWVETYKDPKKSEERQLKFPKLRDYVRDKRAKQKKSDQPTFIKGKTDTIMKKLIESIVSIKASLSKDIQEAGTNKAILDNIICTARKAISTVEYLKIIDVMQTLYAVTLGECSDKIKEEGAELREEQEREECDVDRGEEEINESNNDINDKASLTDDLAEFGEPEDTKDEIPPELLENPD